MKVAFWALAVMTLTVPAAAKRWAVDHGASALEFSGPTQGGNSPESSTGGEPRSHMIPPRWPPLGS
jgi:hypothetical protein